MEWRGRGGKGEGLRRQWGEDRDWMRMQQWQRRPPSPLHLATWKEHEQRRERRGRRRRREKGEGRREKGEGRRVGDRERRRGRLRSEVPPHDVGGARAIITIY